MIFHKSYRSLASVVVLSAALGGIALYLRAPAKEAPILTQQHLQEFPEQTSQKLTSAPMAREADSVLLVVMLLMSATTAAAVASSFYLYRWRRILSADQRFAVPEELISSLREMSKEIRVSRSQLNKVAAELSDETQTLSKRLETTQKG